MTKSFLSWPFGSSSLNWWDPFGLTLGFKVNSKQLRYSKALGLRCGHIFLLLQKRGAWRCKWWKHRATSKGHTEARGKFASILRGLCDILMHTYGRGSLNTKGWWTFYPLHTKLSRLIKFLAKLNPEPINIRKCLLIDASGAFSLQYWWLVLLKLISFGDCGIFGLNDYIRSVLHKNS